MMKVWQVILFLLLPGMQITIAENVFVTYDKNISISLQGSNRYPTIDYTLETVGLSTPFLEFGFIGFNMVTPTHSGIDKQTKVITAALIADAILAGLTKYTVNRKRPERTKYQPRLYNTRITPSFPSGHVSLSAAFSTIMAAYNPEFKPPLILYTLASAYSQVYVGNHYLSDAIGGIILGIIVGNTVINKTDFGRSNSQKQTIPNIPLYLTFSVPLSSK